MCPECVYIEKGGLEHFCYPWQALGSHTFAATIGSKVGKAVATGGRGRIMASRCVFPRWWGLSTVRVGNILVL